MEKQLAVFVLGRCTIMKFLLDGLMNLAYSVLWYVLKIVEKHVFMFFLFQGIFSFNIERNAILSCILYLFTNLELLDFPESFLFALEEVVICSIEVTKIWYICYKEGTEFPCETCFLARL